MIGNNINIGNDFQSEIWKLNIFIFGKGDDIGINREDNR